ncbi:MAG: PrsW family glutamic-type intramembrane protease [Anaerolineales bacterium]
MHQILTSEPIPPLSPEPPRRDTWDRILIITGSLGLGLGMATAAALGLLSIFAKQPIALGVEAASIFVLGLLGAPAIYWGAKGSADRAVRRPGSAWILAMLLYPLALVLGILAFEVGTLTRVLGPIAHIIAAGAPVLFVISISLTRGPLLSARRRWAHFLAGLWVTPPLSLFLELVTVVLFGLLMILGLAFAPDGQSLIQELLEIDLSSQSEVVNLMERLLTQPIVILLGVGLLSGAVPLIEEFLKTITIWPRLGRPMTASAAFLGGALGGAGYALFESLFLPQPGEEWAITMVARAGTPLIHAFNTGLVCWGLAEGVRRRRWLFFAGTYILAVGLHGMWNLAAIGIGLSGLGIETEASTLDPSLLTAVGYLGLLGLVGLTVGSLAGLIWLPARLDSGASDLPRRT